MSEALDALRQEARSPQTQDARLMQLALHEQPTVRQLARKHATLPKDFLTFVHRVEARDRTVPPDQLMWLMDFGPYAHYLVARHPRALTTTLKALLDQGQVLEIARHPYHRGALLQIIHEGDRPLLERLLLNRSLPKFLRRAISDRLATLPARPSPAGGLDTFNRDLTQARNAATDPNILAGLAAHPDLIISGAARKNPSTPRDVLGALQRVEAGEPLSEDDRNILAHLASPKASGPVAAPAPPAPLMVRLRDPHSEVTAEEFESVVSGPPRLQRWAALHAKTPEPMLDQLANAGFETEVRRNLQARARHPETHQATLRRYARSADWELREAVAGNPAASNRLVEQLLQDPDWWVRATAAEHRKATPERLAQLAEEPYHVIIREHVAGHPHTPEATLEALARDTELSVRLAVARNPVTASAALNLLAADASPRVREAVVAHPMTTGGTVERLLQDPHPPVRELAQLRRAAWTGESVQRALTSRRRTVRTVLAAAPGVGEDVRARLAGDRFADVRAQVAFHPELPDEVRARLKEDRDPFVRLIARAADPQAEPADLIQLPRHDQRVRVSLARNPRAPTRLLEQLSTHESPIVRIAVARNPSTDERGLGNLIPDLDTRDYLRQHQRFDGRLRARLRVQELEEAGDFHATAETLSRLSTSDFPDVRAAVARHVNTTDWALERLAADDQDEVHRALLGRPQLAASVQSALVSADDESTWEALLRRPDLAEATLERMGRDARPVLRELVSRSMRTPASVLEAMARRAGEDIVILEGLCLHTNVTPEVLRQVARDPRAAIRVLPLRQAKIEPALLSRLAGDPDELVVRAALTHPSLPASALGEVLQRFPKLQDQVVAHPNTPGSVLERAAADPVYTWVVRLTRRTSFTASDPSWLGRWVHRRAMRQRALLLEVIRHPNATPRALTLATRGRDVAIREALKARTQRLRDDEGSIHA